MLRKTCRWCDKEKAISMFFSFKDSVETLSVCKKCSLEKGTVLSVGEANFVMELIAERRRHKNKRREENFKNKHGFSRRRNRYKYKPVNAEGERKKCVICNKSKDLSLFYLLTETSKTACCKNCIGKGFDGVPKIELDIHAKRLFDTRKRERIKRRETEKANGTGRKNTFKNTKKHIGFKPELGYSLHHWNYDFKYSWDVFLILETEHKKAHLLMKREKGETFYRTLANEPLDTKEKHFDYLNQRGVILEHCKKSKIRVSDKAWCRGTLSKMAKFQSKMWL